MADDVLEPAYSECAGDVALGVASYGFYTAVAMAGLHLYLDATSARYRRYTSPSSRWMLAGTSVALLSWMGGYRAKEECEQRIAWKVAEELWKRRRKELHCPHPHPHPFAPPPQRRPPPAH